MEPGFDGLANPFDANTNEIDSISDMHTAAGTYWNDECVFLSKNSSLRSLIFSFHRPQKMMMAPTLLTLRLICGKVSQPTAQNYKRRIMQIRFSSAMWQKIYGLLRR
jgi:hypothetical protein